MESMVSSEKSDYILDVPPELEPEDFKAGPVDDTYVFVREEITPEFAGGYESSSFVRIRSTHEEPESDGTFVCVAQLRWRSFRADFTCIYDPSDKTYSDFQEESMGGSMEKQVDEVFISFDRKKEPNGKLLKAEVPDDNDNPFMFVFFDLVSGGSSLSYACLFGKKALAGQGKKDVKLTNGEKERLEQDGVEECPSEVEDY